MTRPKYRVGDRVILHRIPAENIGTWGGTTFYGIDPDCFGKEYLIKTVWGELDRGVNMYDIENKQGPRSRSRWAAYEDMLVLVNPPSELEVKVADYIDRELYGGG